MPLYDDYLNEYLKTASGIQKGTTTPMDLPQNRYLKTGIQQGMNQYMKQILDQIYKQGLTGGAASGLLKSVPEAGINANVGAEKTAYETALGEGIDISKFLGQEALEKQKMQNQLWEFYKSYKLAKQQGKLAIASAQSGQMNSQMPNVNSAMQSCCFIMVENDDLTDAVRSLRNELFSPDSWIARGYRKMARWLVPMMKKQRIVKRIVKFLMTHPIAKYSEKKNPALIPICVFWCLVWELYGRWNAISERPLYT